MTERKQGKKSKKKARPKQSRVEHRFLPQQTQTSKLAVAAGGLGALVLGAGVYGQWIRDDVFEQSPFLIAFGGLVLIAALVFGSGIASPVRVGDAGVAVEKGDDLTRLPWCDIERIHVDTGKLVLRSPNLTLELPVAAHRGAVAWILSEAVRRVPGAMDVKESILKELPKPEDDVGERVPLDMLQVTGRRCASSDRMITFEREARLCPTCAQVYHQESVPKTCVTCGDTLAGRTLQV